MYSLFTHNINFLLQSDLLQGGLDTSLCALALNLCASFRINGTPSALVLHCALNISLFIMSLSASMTNCSPVWVPTLPTLKSLFRGDECQ